MKTISTYTDEALLNQIHYLREQKVMFDLDLAVLYGVETKRLKEAVRRNQSRFPEDFMFEMSEKEFQNQRTQIASFNALKYKPFCFTEQGVAMLSSVLNSERYRSQHPDHPVFCEDERDGIHAQRYSAPGGAD